MAKVLVIGGSGFVGHSLLRDLRDQGCQLWVLNRGHRAVQGAHQIVADRHHPEQMAQAAQHIPFCDAVIDTSSYTGDHTAWAWQALAHKTRRWVHLSSAAVYQPSAHPPSEDCAIGGAPIWGAYGVEKSAADAFLLAQRDGPELAIVRPPYLYGPGNDNDRETFVWDRVLAGYPVLIPGDGQTPIQFLHVQDLARLLVCLAVGPTRRDRVFNAAAAEVVTLHHWVQHCCACVPTGGVAHILGDLAGDIAPRSYFPFRDYPCVVDGQRALALPDWQPHFSLAAGLAQTFRSTIAKTPVLSPSEQRLAQAVYDDAKVVTPCQA